MGNLGLVASRDGDLMWDLFGGRRLGVLGDIYG